MNARKYFHVTSFYLSARGVGYTKLFMLLHKKKSEKSSRINKQKCLQFMKLKALKLYLAKFMKFQKGIKF